MDILKAVMQSLGTDGLKQIGRKLGTDESKAQQATQTTLSALVGALSRNASSNEGAASLHRALQKDHDGGLLDNFAGLLDDPSSGSGEGILRHVLGGRRESVQRALGQATGVDSGGLGKLMTVLAPMVLGALGKAQRQGGMDAGALAGLLGRERKQLETREPQGMALLGKLLDADGDGDVDLGDILKRGAGLLGKLGG